MKKIFTISFLIIAFFGVNDSALAFDFNLKHLNPFNKKTIKTEKSSVIVIAEKNTIKIIKKDNKYGIIDKKTNKYILKPVADNIEQLDTANDAEYKVNINGNTGYMNLNERYNLFADYDDIYKIGDLLRIKRNSRYGLIDTKGNVIIDAIYDKIYVVKHSNDVQNIVAKLDGKYTLFTMSGKLIPESDLYSVSGSDKEEQSQYMLIRDLRSELKSGKQYNLIVYEKVMADTLDNTSDEIYEVQKSIVSAPDVVSEKTALLQEEKTQPEEKVQPEENTVLKENSGQVEKVRTVENTKLKEKNKPDKKNKPEKKSDVKVSGSDTPKTDNSRNKGKFITVSGKKYYIVSKNSLGGIENSRGKLIIPPEYDNLTTRKFDKNKVVFEANNKKNFVIYDLRGNIIAKHDKSEMNVICIYQYGKEYKYAYKGNSEWLLSYKNKEIGRLLLNKNNCKYERRAFAFANINKINNVLKFCLGID